VIKDRKVVDEWKKRGEGFRKVTLTRVCSTMLRHLNKKDITDATNEEWKKLGVALKAEWVHYNKDVSWQKSVVRWLLGGWLVKRTYKKLQKSIKQELEKKELEKKELEKQELEKQELEKQLSGQMVSAIVNVKQGVYLEGIRKHGLIYERAFNKLFELRSESKMDKPSKLRAELDKAKEMSKFRQLKNNALDRIYRNFYGMLIEGKAKKGKMDVEDKKNQNLLKEYWEGKKGCRDNPKKLLAIADWLASSRMYSLFSGNAKTKNKWLRYTHHHYQLALECMLEHESKGTGRRSPWASDKVKITKRLSALERMASRIKRGS